MGDNVEMSIEAKEKYDPEGPNHVGKVFTRKAVWRADLLISLLDDWDRSKISPLFLIERMNTEVRDLQQIQTSQHVGATS